MPRVKQRQATPVFRQFDEVNADVKLPVIDRIRILFGCKIYTKTTIATQWLGEIKTHSSLGIEKFFKVPEFWLKWRHKPKAMAVNRNGL